MTSDVEIFVRWRAGDNAAGSELFRRHFDALYRFFGNKLADEAEDLIQATWMMCLRYGNRVAEAESFRAYLFTIARNELFRTLRKGSGRSDAELSTSAICDLSPSPSTMAAASERDRRLLAALRALPLESQLVLELHYWEDLTTAELAAVLEIPQGTVKSRIRRAREQLQAALGRAEVPAVGDALDQWVRSMRRQSPASP